MGIIDDIRRANARQLSKECGGNAEFSRKVGFSDARTSQLLGEKFSRNIGHKAAAQIEEAFKLSTGWLSVNHDYQTHPSNDTKQVEEPSTGYDKPQLIYATPDEIALLSRYREITKDSQAGVWTALQIGERDEEKITRILKRSTGLT